MMYHRQDETRVKKMIRGHVAYMVALLSKSTSELRAELSQETKWAYPFSGVWVE